MKKKNIINLIRYYCEKNDSAFRNEAYEIASYFDKNGDYELSEYIMSLLSNVNTFVPQIAENNLTFFKKIKINNTPLPLPENIKNELLGIINAVSRNVGINKFLFEGEPGTGKTESVKQMARILNRDLYSVRFDVVVDSKLGQTSKNISSLFDEIKNLPHPEKVIILFDEIDAIALDRLNNNDIREMGRATSAILKELDDLNSDIVFIATTNLYNSFDKALIRRFDAVINFNDYSKDDLVEVGEVILNDFLIKFKINSKNMKLFKKILSCSDTIPYPGDLKNIIKTSIAFSNVNDEYDYLKKIYLMINKKKNIELKELQEQGFTVRERDALTGVSKSKVSRELRNENEEYITIKE